MHLSTWILGIAGLLIPVGLFAQTDSSSRQKAGVGDTVATPKIPFDGMDLTWLNGQNRQTDFPLSNNAITGMVYVETYYNYNFARPKDNTQTISSTIGRTNEITVNLASIGLEANYKNVIGRLWLQTGAMLSIVQDLDQSSRRGRNLSVNDLRNLREAAAGYHFDKGYGLNLEMGIFMSYIGLESYMTQENWNYQRSMLTEYTPFYFSGIRAQYYPTHNYKMEFWLMNGWASYSKWNQAPAIGTCQYYRPTENLQLVGNLYLGTDTREQPGRIRFHHDNSVEYRYRRKKPTGINQAAFSLNNHAGFESGGYQADRFTGDLIRDEAGNPIRLTSKQAYFFGTALAHRIWFAKSKLAFTTRVDLLAHGSFYATDSPGPYADRVEAFRNAKVLRMAQGTATLDIMPNDHFTLRLEYVRRQANIPYFAGPQGTTGPSGYNDVPVPASYIPDQVRTENRLTLSASIRI